MKTTQLPPAAARTGRRSPFALLLGALALFLGTSCSSTVENRDPVGEPFPSVTGRSLEKKEVALPPGEACVLLLGYAQDAQFDADRWLIGILQAPPGVRVMEVPTIPGLFPRAISGWIDSGMRSGIPEEDWQSVVTVYGSPASEIVELTGNTRPRNIRVVLLDAEGKVRWFHDRGFSAGKLLELRAAVKTLAES